MKIQKICLLIWIFIMASAFAGEKEVEQGPHGGRLFQQGNISLEILLFEEAMPAHFRAYCYQKGKITPLSSRALTMTLTRFHQQKERITFVPVGRFLQSKEVIQKPHSFDIAIALTLHQQHYAWNYAAYQGRVRIAPAMLQAAKIQTSIAGSRTIQTKLQVVGKISPNRDTLAPIYARYAGIIQKMEKNLGEEVKKGEPLLTLESNESLQNYHITAPITGTIVQKYATHGELAQNTKPIYEIANLATVWADFTLYRKEVPLVKQGMEVIVTGDEGKPRGKSTISYIASFGIEDSQTTLVRAVLSNQNKLWLPGMYVNGAIIIKEKKVPVAVPLSAIQRIDKQEMVFVKRGEELEATPVVVGIKDAQWVEVLSGLTAGQCYVSSNSFFIKAEIGKAGASDED